MEKIIIRIKEIITNIAVKNFGSLSQEFQNYILI